MKRISLFICLVFCALLFSCGKSDYTVTAESKEPISTNTTGDTLYIVNISTRSYHLPSCYILNNTKEENKRETYDIEFLTEREYTPCKICIDND
ncbi:MAG: hypothetical protein J6A96_04770 [Clostridia bacterium]|nr:hypothetical protein [Clostridia bacterium]